MLIINNENNNHNNDNNHTSPEIQNVNFFNHEAPLSFPPPFPLPSLSRVVSHNTSHNQALSKLRVMLVMCELNGGRIRIVALVCCVYT
jgi:hypothetical protein